MRTINAILARDMDSCVTVTDQVCKGDVVSYHLEDDTVCTVTALEDIPQWHKIAIKPLKEAEICYKYGEKIGRAKSDIVPGDYVHIHNVAPLGFQEG